MAPMKIGLVTEFYYPTLGGIQEHVHHFALQAMQRGHEVRIVTSRVHDVAPDVAVERVPTLRLGRSVPVTANGSVGRLTLGRRLGDRLEEVFERERFDVVHVHAPLTPVLPLLAVARSRTLTVGTFHANFPRLPFAGLISRAGQPYMDRLDGVIGVSRTAVAASARYFDARWTIIPNGVDTERFRPDVAPAQRASTGGFTILWVGRMEPRNGLDRMLAAFKLAAARRRDLSLLVVGDGPLRRRYERMVPTPLRPRVRFMGFQNTGRPALYASADLLCVPATISSFGITLLEGMAAGRPVIASDIDGFRDVLGHEREGLLVDTADARAFADAILRCADDRAFSAACGARGRATAEAYAWPRVADRVLAFYGAAAARRGIASPC
jgi:phosphatidylinositol alpha-mannosyltransferase